MSSDNFESNDVTLSEQTYAHIAHDFFLHSKQTKSHQKRNVRTTNDNPTRVELKELL